MPVLGRIVDMVEAKRAVLPPPRERATWAWTIGEEGGDVRPHARL